MEDVKKQAKDLMNSYVEAADRLDIAGTTKEFEYLQDLIQQPDFWNDNLAAQEAVRKHAKLESRIKPWQNLKKELTSTLELIELDDESLKVDIIQGLNDLSIALDKLKEDLKFTGLYDDHDAILTLSAGAGGTDAQDWTAMLLRMYTRWAEHERFQVNLIEESPGEEAGTKRATLAIVGPFAFGRLISESGVHRLVRLSPFNSDNLRQTSFAKVEVIPKIDKPSNLNIDPKDLKIDVYRAGGHGGQSVNTTDSAVRITHLPTGVSVAIQNERSQLQNKELAMTILRSRLVSMQLEQHQEVLSKLKGPNQSAEWGSQIRSYVLHPYKQVKDLRTRHETNDTSAVLDGDLNQFINAYLEYSLGKK